jgi:hypothetical protein
LDFEERVDSTLRAAITNLFDLEPPRFPIAGTASSMGHRDDFNRLIGHTVNYGVRKAAQQVFSCAVQIAEATAVDCREFH